MFARAAWTGLNLPADPTAHLPLERKLRVPLSLRYEDISQDGRLALSTAGHALSALVWSRALEHHRAREEFLREGIVPILSRLVVRGEEGRIGIRTPVEAEGGFEVVRSTESKVRYRIDMVAKVFSAQENGERKPLLSILAEHVLTRPFAPPSQRALDRLPGSLSLDGERPELPPQGLLEEGEVEWLEAMAQEPVPIVFGIGHTDANQHVNSLAYLRLFEDAILRHLAALGLHTRRFLVLAELRYRKPCFAGEALFLWLRSYKRMLSLGYRIGTVAVLVEQGEQIERGRVFGRFEFEE
ncbi:MAG: acyl-CoA thioesterase [Deltaproteobacteria bacterium]|nr:acyl-CoA thioesterase [Deltaproteobacteria bacterium]